MSNPNLLKNYFLIRLETLKLIIYSMEQFRMEHNIQYYIQL